MLEQNSGARTKRSSLSTMTPETTDSLLQELGGCGLFQVIVTAVCVLMEMSLAFSMMMMAFGGYNPGMTCLTSYFNQTLDNNNNSNNNNNNISSQDHSDELWISADNNNISFFSSNVSTHNWSTTCSEVHSCPGEIIFKDSASTVVTEWGLVCDQAWIISLIISLQMVGVLLASLASGQLATRYGRKPTVYVGLACNVVFNVVGALSVSWKMFAVLRFLTGFAIGTVITICVVYNTEYLTQWGRSVVSMLPVWPIVNIIFALLMMGLKNWRYIQYTTAGFTAVVFLTVVWMPESMRWLAVHGKITRAKLIPDKIARLNRKSVPKTDVLENLQTMKDKLETKGTQLFPYIDLFRKEFIKPTVVLSVVYFSLSTVYYAVAFGMSTLSGNFYINYMMLPVARIPFQLCGEVLVTCVGRRCLAPCYMGISMMSSVGVVIIQNVMDEESRDLPTSILVILCFGSLGPTWSVIKVWVMELYPTTTRTTAFGWGQCMARVGGIVAPYLIPKTVLPLYACYIILGIFQALSICLMLTLPETKDQPLPDVNTQSLEIRGITSQLTV